jgi:peptidoglycan/xylan/chitin deacetylase (PgdA/CDA1 family)
MTRLDFGSRIKRKLRWGSDIVGDLVHQRLSNAVTRCFYRAVIILVYHRIARPSSDPYKIAVSPARFEEHLVALRLWGRALRLRELPGLLASDSLPHRGYVVTFDDGYADNLLNAKPLLEKYDTPATVFAASEYAPGGREFWWDVVDELRMYAAAKGTKIKAGTERIDPSRNVVLHERLAKSTRREVDAVIAELVAQIGAEVHTKPEGLPMTAPQLHELSASGLVDIGAHTITHRRLAVLSESEQQAEIFGAKRSLEKVLDRPVETFAYPFGASGTDYSVVSQRLVREAGYSCACAVQPFPVGRKADLYGLPRCWVSDWDGDELARRLRFWYVR